MCLDTHLGHASQYHTFWQEARGCEKWMDQQVDRLNNEYDQTDLAVEDTERLLTEIQGMRETLTEYQSVIDQLHKQSSQVVPLKQRGQPVTSPKRVKALCAYKQLKVLTFILPYINSKFSQLWKF